MFLFLFCFIQRYYWLKKSYLITLPPEKENYYALASLETMFKEVMLYLRPKYKVAQSLQSACQQLEDHLTAVACKAKEILPDSSIDVQSILKPSEAKPQVTGLGTIAEEDNDDAIPFVSKSCGGDWECSENGDPGTDTDEEKSEGQLDFHEREDSDDDNEDYELDNEEHHDQKPTVLKCVEDDEFQRDLERMMSENIQSRSSEVVRSKADIVIPIIREEKKIKFSDETFQENEDKFSFGVNSISEQEHFNFRVMTRNVRSNKAVLKRVQVSRDNDLVHNFLTRQQELHKKKEEVKMLTLDINQRSELQQNSTVPNTDSVSNSTPYSYATRTSGHQNKPRSQQYNSGYQRR